MKTFTRDELAEALRARARHEREVADARAYWEPRLAVPPDAPPLDIVENRRPCPRCRTIHTEAQGGHAHRCLVCAYAWSSLDVPRRWPVAEPSLRVLTIIETPFPCTRLTRAYAHRCLLDSIARGEAPFASHLFYPRVLDDAIPAERALGIAMGHAWGGVAARWAFYIDLDVTAGMIDGWIAAREGLAQVEFRALGRDVMQAIQTELKEEEAYLAHDQEIP